MLLEGTFPHLVQLVNAGEVNEKREALRWSQDGCVGRREVSISPRLGCLPAAGEGL